MSAQVRKKVDQELERLSEIQQQEVLDFVRFLRTRSRSGKRRSAQPPAGVDLLDGFVGAVEIGNLASYIDDELYGTRKRDAVR